MYNRRIGVAAIGLLMLVILAAPGNASGAGVTVLCSNGIKAVMEELAPQFEQATKHKLAITYGLSAALKQQIDAGAPFDVAILTPPLIDDLLKQQKVSSATVLARSPIAIAIRAGAARPDITTTDALTRTLLSATSIAYAGEGAGGLFFTALIQRLGLADRLKSTVRPTATGAEVSASVALGGAQLGVMPLSEILPVPGIEPLGAFPPDVAGYLVMTAGVSGGTQGAAAKELVAFLMKPDVLPVLKKRGMARD